MIDRLYFVRHGQSECNARHVYAGVRADIKLTAHGRSQAETAGRLLLADGITRIIASDLDRARDTACIIAGIINFPEEEIAYDSRLREVNVGKLTGQTDEGFVEYLRYTESGADPTAETIEQIEARLRPVLAELEAQQGTVLIVAHAGVARVMKALLTGVSIDDIARLDIPNAHPFELPLNRLREGRI